MMIIFQTARWASHQKMTLSYAHNLQIFSSRRQWALAPLTCLSSVCLTRLHCPSLILLRADRDYSRPHRRQIYPGGDMPNTCEWTLCSRQRWLAWEGTEPSVRLGWSGRARLPSATCRDRMASRRREARRKSLPRSKYQPRQDNEKIRINLKRSSNFDCSP